MGIHSFIIILDSRLRGNDKILRLDDKILRLDDNYTVVLIRFILDKNSHIALLTLVLCVFAYFLPSIIANVRKHNNTLAILMCNLFIGWVISIIWASTNDTKP